MNAANGGRRLLADIGGTNARFARQVAPGAAIDAARSCRGAVLDQLRRRCGHASAERAVSGPGIFCRYEAPCAIVGATAPGGVDAPLA